MNIVTDGQTDNYAEIQSVLDRGLPVVLPAGDILITKPLTIRKPNSLLCGDERGLTRLFGNFGAGHLVVAQSVRDFGPTVVESLVPGPGNALRLGSGCKPLHVYTEPALDCSKCTQLTIRYYFKRLAPHAIDGQHVQFQFCGVYGVESFQSVGIWDWGNGFRVFWRGRTYEVQNVGNQVGVVYHVALVYDGSHVALWVGELGGTANKVLEFAATGNVPMKPNGLETLGIGYEVRGPIGDMASHDAAEIVIDSFEVAGVARYTSPYTVSHSKHNVDADTRFLLNFETDNGMFVGYTGLPGRGQFTHSYIVPNSSETQMGRVTVRNLTFMGQGGASGLLLYDTIKSTVENIEFVNCWTGLVCRGSTYASRFTEIHGGCISFAWVQGPQAMETTAIHLDLASQGIICYMEGSVGGVYLGLYLTPHAGCYACVYVYGSDSVNIYGGQVDDEGQAGDVPHCIIGNSAALKLNGVLLVRGSAGPLIECVNQGSICANGCSFGAPSSVLPQVYIAGVPKQQAVLSGCCFADAPIINTAASGYVDVIG